MPPTVLDAPGRVDIEIVATAPTERAPRVRPRVPLLGVVAIAFIVTVFLIDTIPRASSAFGDSVESMNAGTWLVGSRSLVENGIVESRFGAHSAELGTYAHHPPGIVVAAVISRMGPGDIPLLLRMPAIVASVAAILLLYRLLKESGFSTVSSVAGVAAAAGSPMFLMFGSMMNMEAISLPFILWFLLCWRRGFARRAPAALAAFAAAVTSWQGVFVVGLVGLLLLVSCLRRRRLFDGVLVAVAIGLVAALAVSLAWLLWANGSIAAVTDAAEKRQSVDTLTWRSLLRRQWEHLDSTFPLWTIAVAVPGALIALVDRRTRATLLVTAAVVVAFIVGFLQGSYEHIFWNWWIVVPFALCATAIADRLSFVVDGRSGRRVGRALVLVVSLASVVVVATWTTGVERSFYAGVPAGQLLDEVELPESQTTMYFFYGDEWSTWASWYTHRSVTTVWTSSELREIGRREPDSLVLVRKRWPFDDDRAWQDVESHAVASRGGSYALVRADVFADVVSRVGL